MMFYAQKIELGVWSTVFHSFLMFSSWLDWLTFSRTGRGLRLIHVDRSELAMSKGYLKLLAGLKPVISKRSCPSSSWPVASGFRPVKEQTYILNCNVFFVCFFVLPYVVYQCNCPTAQQEYTWYFLWPIHTCPSGIDIPRLEPQQT